MLLAKVNARATMGSRCLLAQTIVVVAPAVQVMQVQVTVGCKLLPGKGMGTGGETLLVDRHNGGLDR